MTSTTQLEERRHRRRPAALPSEPPATLEWIGAWLFAIVLFWAPLPFASVTPAARLALVATVAAVVLICRPLSAAARLPGRIAVALGLLVVLGLLAAAQAIPLPVSVLRLLAPGQAERLAEMSLTMGTVSVTPQTTALYFAMWWWAAAAMLAAFALARSRRVRRLWLGALAGSALFQVVYGGQRLAADDDRIWGVQVADAQERMRGSFVNPNHFAFYLAVLLPVLVAVLWWAWRRRERMPVAPALLAFGAPALVALMLAFGLVLSGSRGGVLAAALAVGCQGLLIVTGERRRLAAVALLLVLVGGVTVVVSTAGDQEGLVRVASAGLGDLAVNQRVGAFRTTWDMWRDAPLLGSGMASFREAFELHRRPGVEGDWWHAHSDWLEVLATLGLIGLVLLAVAFLLVLWTLWHGFRADGRSSEDRAAALAGLGALLAAAFHSAGDFGMTMPANAVTVLVVVGAAVGAVPSVTSVASERSGSEAIETGDGPRRHAPDQPHDLEAVESGTSGGR